MKGDLDYVNATLEFSFASVLGRKKSMAKARQLIGRYAQALQTPIMQSAACFSMHSVEERCSRWLLMTHDRVGRDNFQLTHEFLGYMLGTRRPTVSLVLGTLEKAGIIQNGTKRITIVNRKKLEAASCECYPIVKVAFDRLLPA